MKLSYQRNSLVGKSGYSKKNVLHAIDVCETGGAENVFLQLITHIDRTKYNPVVLIPGTGWLYDQLIKIDIQPLIVNMRGSLNYRYLLELIRIIKRHKISLIHSHLFGSNIYCSVAGFLSRRPVISTFHGIIDVADDERWLGLKTLLVRLGTTKFVFVSEFLKQNLQSRLNIKDQHCMIIYNGVDVEYFGTQIEEDYRKKYGISQDEIFVALVGNINYSKGYDILISAAKYLIDKPFKFIVAGDCSDEIFKRLSQQLINCNLEDKIIFAGFINNAKDFIKSADIYLLSSRDEGFSISTIEAMAAGKPVIVTKSGGPEEIVEHDVNGLVIDNEAPEQMAASLLRITNDNSLRERLIKAASMHVISCFSIRRTINEYMSLYNHLLFQNLHAKSKQHGGSAH